MSLSSHNTELHTITRNKNIDKKEEKQLNTKTERPLWSIENWYYGTSGKWIITNKVWSNEELYLDYRSMLHEY